MLKCNLLLVIIDFYRQGVAILSVTNKILFQITKELLQQLSSS